MPIENSNDILDDFFKFLGSLEKDTAPRGAKADDEADLLTAVALEYCAVYLRPECVRCALGHLIKGSEEFMSMMVKEHSDLANFEESSEKQFYRQLVIWARERLDVWIKEPCSMKEQKNED